MGINIIAILGILLTLLHPQMVTPVYASQPVDNPVKPILANLTPHPGQFPNMAANYQQTIVIPQLKAQQASCEAAGGTFDSGTCTYPPPPVQTAQAIPQPATAAAVTAAGGLIGSIGYSLAGGNCVDMARAYGKLQPGNPISWVATTQTPFIGAAALFPYNHVGVIVGLWSNGDVEIAQENAPGMPHRFPQSAFRGFF